MSKLGKFGALAGLGQSVAAVADDIRKQWLLAAQAQEQERQEARADQREARSEAFTLERDNLQHTRTLERDDRTESNAREREGLRTASEIEMAELRHQFDVDLEGIRQTGRMNEVNATTERVLAEKGATAEKPEYWRAGDVSYMRENGKTYMLPEGSNQWERVLDAGATSTRVDPDLMYQANQYADQRVKEKAGIFSLDSSDFGQFEGSREKAREAYRQEFLQGRGASSGAVNPTEAAVPSDAQLPPILQQTRESAMRALQGGVPLEAIVQRLRESGATDEEIRMMGF